MSTSFPHLIEKVRHHTRALVYTVIAVVFGVIATLLPLMSTKPWAPTNIALTVAFVAPIPFLRRFPRLVGVALGVLSVTSNLFVSEGITAQFVVGLVAAEWSYRRWYAPVGVFFVADFLSWSRFYEYGIVANVLLSVFLFGFIYLPAILTGVMLRQKEEIAAAAEMREELLRLEIAASRQADLVSLANQLHDTVATELTHAILGLRALASDSLPTGSKHEVDLVQQSAGKAMSSLRTLIAELEDHPADESPLGRQPRRTFREEIDHSRRLLAVRSISLDVSGLNIRGIDSDTSPEEREFLTAFIREAVVNAAKYAPAGSRVTVDSMSAPECFTIDVASMIDTATGAPQAASPLMSNGHGLTALKEQARRIGAQVDTGVASGMWFIGATLPAARGVTA